MRSPGGAAGAMAGSGAGAGAGSGAATPLPLENKQQQTLTLLSDTPNSSLKQLCKDIKSILNDGELVIIEKKFQKIRLHYY